MAAVPTTARIQPVDLFAPVTTVTSWTVTLKPVLVRLQFHCIIELLVL